MRCSWRKPRWLARSNPNPRGAVSAIHEPTSVARFRVWLAERGAEVLEPTNPYEVIRFRAGGCVSVIYRNQRGAISSMVGEAQNAWESFRNSGSWTAGNAAPRRPLTPKMRAVIARDGEECFFCGRHVDQEHASLEHLVSRTHGGPNHVANLVLAHKSCNQKAGTLSAIEKVRLREKMRS